MVKIISTSTISGIIQNGTIFTTSIEKCLDEYKVDHFKDGHVEKTKFSVNSKLKIYRFNQKS